jgi:hypothetical protein
MSWVPPGPRPAKLELRDKRRREREESKTVATTEEMFAQIREVLGGAGMKPAVVAALLKRLELETPEARRLSPAQLLEEMEKKTSLVLSYIDEYSASTAGLKDLSIALSTLIEKQQLLKNQPTHIVDFTSRQELRVVMPALLAEAKRRGITIEGIAEKVAS